MRHVITIDPGENTAISFFIDGKYFTSRFLSVKGIKNKEDRNTKLLDFIESYIINILDCIVVIEGVRVYNSVVSMSAATSGKLEWLHYLVGGIIALCKIHKIKCKKINDNEWKGNLSKTVVKNRVNLRLTDEEKINLKILNKFFKNNQHVYDSIGMGLWYLKRF